MLQKYTGFRKIPESAQLLDLTHNFSEAAEYKINIQESTAFRYTNDETSEKEIMKTIPFLVLSKPKQGSEKTVP